MSSQIGNKLKVSIFGESHGNGIGAVIDGFPAGVEIDTDALLAYVLNNNKQRRNRSDNKKNSKKWTHAGSYLNHWNRSRERHVRAIYEIEL